MTSLHSVQGKTPRVEGPRVVLWVSQSWRGVFPLGSTALQQENASTLISGEQMCGCVFSPVTHVSLMFFRRCLNWAFAR